MMTQLKVGERVEGKKNTVYKLNTNPRPTHELIFELIATRKEVYSATQRLVAHSME